VTGLFECEIATDFSANDVGAVDRSMPTDVHRVSNDHTTEIIAGRWEQWRQFNSEFHESVRDHDESL